MKTSRFSDSQIIAILKQAQAGSPDPDRCREHGIISATFYKWRAKFGGMDASLMARLRGLEGENRCLKKMYAEERLKAEFIQEAMAKKWLSHLGGERWRSRQSVLDGSASNKPAWPMVLVPPAIATRNAEIADHLIRLTHNQRNCGFGLCFVHLRYVKGYRWNHKGVYRIYRALGLNLRIKPKKRIVREKHTPIGCARGDQSLLDDGFYARSVGRWQKLPSVQPD